MVREYQREFTPTNDRGRIFFYLKTVCTVLNNEKFEDIGRKQHNYAVRNAK